MGGTSAYMTTLMERLTFVRVEILTPYNVGKLKKDWYVSPFEAEAAQPI